MSETFAEMLYAKNIFVNVLCYM